MEAKPKKKVAWKICSKCKEKKLPHYFRNDPNSFDGLYYWCRVCQREREKSYVARGTARIKQLYRKRHPSKSMAKWYAYQVISFHNWIQEKYEALIGPSQLPER